VSFTGQTSTHSRHALHSSLITRVALWTLIEAGHAFVQSSQSMQVEALRVILRA
jgi:hypothetical protein